MSVGDALASLAVPREYDRVTFDMLVAALETSGWFRDTEAAELLGEKSPWRRSPMGLLVTARLRELRGETDLAIAAWSEVIDRQAGPLAEARLARARLLGQAGDHARAFADLRDALREQNEYAFVTRAAKLYDRLRKKATPPSVRTMRIALLSSTTTDLIAPILRVTCFRDGIDAELYVGPYGAWRQEILDQSSGLYAFKPQLVIIATNWRDANVPAFSDAPDAEVARVANEVTELWRTLLDRSDCRVIQHNFDVPADESYGHLGSSLAGGRARVLRAIDNQLADSAPAAVAVLDVDLASGEFGKRAWFDATMWHATRQYPAPAAIPTLVERQVALVRAAAGLTRKVLVLDLDNTLWGGVIGEDGIEGIKVGPPSAAGEAHQQLQRFASELRDRGIVLAVCSKNNERDAELPFTSHDGMVLKREDIAVFVANWQDKATNLRQIAQTLNVGIDSLVFIDDNPVERALVRRELPEVAVPEIGDDPAGYIAALQRGLHFEAWTLSKEDRERNASYRANAERDRLRTATGSIEDFLRGLDMEAEHGPVDANTLARVVQLLGKTNQFNLTTKRYTEQQVRALLEDPDAWTQWFKLRDRFGDNGLIGEMFLRRSTDDAAVWEIDTWLMSCRVIGRQMEEFMLRTAADAAMARGARELRGTYIPTAKNGLVADLYPRLGFDALGEPGPDGTKRYVLPLAADRLPACDFIRAVQHTA